MLDHVDLIGGLFAMPKRYMVDLHHVVARDKYIANTHVATALGFVLSAALAILVDRGKIKWDDRVIDHMPWFRMYDAWVTREITIRDLLVHRSGLGLGQCDLMFVPRTNLTRKQTVERVAYLKPKTSFRSSYAYDNILYAVAGQLIEEGES